ncbi:hypothetical protein BFL36_13095 [Clavibacter michiganensis]|uniref:Uncharacterized protein n=1 Tax=Clavibacter michiganensis TaxID=28447 RepID=A0A251Y4K0_9MICO|nr:hypothetical protein [Clavibacter michiganensis]OUE18973.1 hypothetical protein BFL36_13095 [Clavibacter michiganensis]
MQERTSAAAGKRRIRTTQRVMIAAFAVLAVAQAVVGVLVLMAADGADENGALGVVMLVGAAVSATLSILFAVALRRSR